MKTNFDKETFFVLTNDEHKVVAIILCEKGEQDITEKLYDAIAEDYDAENVEIRGEHPPMDNFDYERRFTVKITVDGDTYKETFDLTNAAVY